MKPSFWHACWEKNSLGFHQKSIHPFLEQYFLPRIKEEHSSVFVPLCGKSDDMMWLAEHLSVVGAELSDIACRDFFLERNIEASVEKRDAFDTYSYENLTLWQGDFFQLPSHDFQSFDWIYDRAAIIALPEAMQADYVNKLASFISGKTQLFLISVEFPQEQLSGPPFSLPYDRLASLFSQFSVACVAERELEDKTFAQRTFDVSYLREKLYIISRK